MQLHGNYDASWPFGRNTSLPASVSLLRPFSVINFHSFIIFASIETTFCVVITAPIHTLAVILLGVWMFSWPMFDKWSLLIFDECTSFFWGPREGNACDDKRQGVVCQPAWYKAMDLLVLTWQVEMHLSFTVNRGLSIRMVSFAVSPGRHLHLKGHQETLVNKVLKPNHVMVTWHLKKNVIKFLSMLSVYYVLTTPSKQHRLQQKGAWALPNAGCRKCTNRCGRLAGQMWVPCAKIKWSHSWMAMGITHHQKISKCQIPPLWCKSCFPALYEAVMWWHKFSFKKRNHASGEVTWLTISGAGFPRYPKVERS